MCVPLCTQQRAFPLPLLRCGADVALLPPPHRTATRSLRFPDSADMSKVDAKLDNGVLCIWCVRLASPDWCSIPNCGC